VFVALRDVLTMKSYLSSTQVWAERVPMNVMEVNQWMNAFISLNILL
jgi:hypothetical protein